MANWVTHLWIADIVLKRCPDLDRVGFCVGSIAPDCNVENADWTSFTPSREVTHFMTGKRKCMKDAERFFERYISERSFASAQEEGFFWGYFAHLVADAKQQEMQRDEKRVRDSFKRIEKIPELAEKIGESEKTFDTMKRLLPKADRLQDFENIEAEYLENHPDSGYLQVILPLREFPDYTDFLPKGAIVRKIGIMGEMPVFRPTNYPFVVVNRQEHIEYIESAAGFLVEVRRRGRME